MAKEVAGRKERRMAGTQGKSRSGITFIAIGVIILLLVLAAIAPLAMQTSKLIHISPSYEAAPTTTDDGFPVVDWEYWQEVNPDVIGWLTIPNTTINTPIVQASSADPEFYLHHDVYRERNILGCPYLDSSSEEAGFESKNCIIYGHSGGSFGMQFTEITYYADYQYLTEHSIIFLQTPDCKIRLVPSFCDVAPGWELNKRTEFSSYEDFQDFYNSQFHSAYLPIELQEDVSQMFTLVACSYYFTNNERTILVAMEISEA